MDHSQNIQINHFSTTPYKEVTSHYVGHELKPSDINPNYQVFPQTYNVQEGNLTYEYKPKLIMSGYIVG